MPVKPVIEPVYVRRELTDIFGLFGNKAYSCFLDSASHICNLGWLSRGREYYSIIGIEPFLVFKSSGKNADNPFKALKELFREYHIQGNDLPAPFYCGAVGYFGYDLCHFIEKLPSNVLDDLSLPDCILCFYDPMIIYDHRKNKLFICSVGINPESKNITKEIKAKLKEVPERNIPPEPRSEGSFSSNFTKQKYLKAVAKAKEYIAAGDIFQVNLSQRFETGYSGDTYALYRKLRGLSPAPFMSYLNFGDLTAISSSPERFLKLSGGIVETRPMKGTRPRGKTKEEDLKLKKELLESRKDKAELVMIVDLLRNDLGKVCKYNSVKVKTLRTIEEHPTVFQTTSTVTGKLVNTRDYIDLLKACFPGGSITGCPKVRSMQIIDELEPTKRGIYTGALGFLSFNGDMDLSIVIRTIVSAGRNNALFQVGGGIVADSIPEAEYEETLNKARAMMLALELI